MVNTRTICDLFSIGLTLQVQFLLIKHSLNVFLGPNIEITHDTSV